MLQFILTDSVNNNTSMIFRLSANIFYQATNKKQIIIPSKFNDVYTRYNDIQKKQGFDLEQYKGKKATIYTYSITNYKSNNNVVADLIVYDGKLIGADLCDPSADSGFLTALSGKD